MARTYKSRMDAEKAAEAKNKKAKSGHYAVETRYQVISKGKKRKKKFGRPYIDLSL